MARATHRRHWSGAWPPNELKSWLLQRQNELLISRGLVTNQFLEDQILVPPYFRNDNLKTLTLNMTKTAQLNALMIYSKYIFFLQLQIYFVKLFLWTSESPVSVCDELRFRFTRPVHPTPQSTCSKAHLSSGETDSCHSHMRLEAANLVWLCLWRANNNQLVYNGLINATQRNEHKHVAWQWRTKVTCSKRTCLIVL